MMGQAEKTVCPELSEMKHSTFWGRSGKQKLPPIFFFDTS